MLFDEDDASCRPAKQGLFDEAERVANRLREIQPAKTATNWTAKDGFWRQVYLEQLNQTERMVEEDVEFEFRNESHPRLRIGFSIKNDTEKTYPHL